MFQTETQGFSEQDFASIIKNQKERTPEDLMKAFNQVKKHHGVPQHVLSICANAKEKEGGAGLGIGLVALGDPRVLAEAINQGVQLHPSFAKVLADGVARAIVANPDFCDMVNRRIDQVGRAQAPKHPLQELFDFLESIPNR